MHISFGLINMILPTDDGEIYVSAMDGKLVKLGLNPLHACISVMKEN